MQLIPNVYQATIFAKFDDIKPDTKIIQSLFINLINWDVFPNITREVTIEFQNANGAIKPIEKTVNRLQFISSDQSKRINFLSNRIDISCFNTKENKLGSLSQFCLDVVRILEWVYAVFPQKANRLSLVTSFYSKETNSEYLEKSYKDLFPNIKLDVTTRSWSHQATNLINQEIGNKSEQLNLIYAFGRGQQANGQAIYGQLNNSLQPNFDRLDFGFDINTVPNNTDFRFKLEDLRDFYGKIVVWNDKLTNEVVKLFI